MSISMLVHGAWCWRKVIPLLQSQSYTAFAPDLPGHGQDRTLIPEITLQSYVDRISELLDSLNEPAILVGHSMAGVVVSQVAEQRPDRVEALA